MITIRELNQFCLLNDKIILVRNGKLCGFIHDYDR